MQENGKWAKLLKGPLSTSREFAILNSNTKHLCLF